ncbi:phosphotransferase family enzyme [Anseongella ginsenosidimutans]|uniref:Phosphotransferase family enzyme n=1 Tax=Anseongella ginsenosidimutans TaxID=496056 RepID=A0A4V2UTM8_9SPHI|nr:AarF/UbiB family protein [Anseongella ginsenosidimutans]QEC52267.1 phosphotransferase [Anseongella ginsenosidimutans]TCS86822.1 phosphotransferase family enzyme [Anseongella ginsenosidimutans]
MKEQNSIPSSRISRSGKFIGTGIRIGGNYLKHYSKKLVNPQLDREELNKDNAEDIYNSLSQLKGSALKVAQMLSMDRNLLPKAYTDRFSMAQYNAPPLSGPLIIKTFTRHFGKPPSALFDEFNLHSSNAASIGQVHRARLNDRELAVKVQYPGVAESISSDLKMVKPFALKLMDVSEKELSVYMQEVEEKLLEETDYELELERSRFFTDKSSLPGIVFPRYYPELSCKKVITMDWLEGLHLREFLQTDPSAQVRNQIGQALWDFYNFQLHELRAVHADPHPGNFLVLPGGKLGIIDFGCIKELPEDFYSPFFSFVCPQPLSDREETIACFRQMQMILPGDTEGQVEFYYRHYKEMIALFALPYKSGEFDFGRDEYFRQLYGYGEKVTKMKEFKQARGVKHFIYMNRTLFGLYNILNELKAHIRTDTYPARLRETLCSVTAL